ncbi:uracil-DNA glycosylase family protein [Candidatus Albibeggiatoa sp. nov. NOAA]|uniref:uracil-DNA glycosylase family protein n=1 Tax=Candidatus Albibeggiatoa sp. nov. NOAA TaxID=3162724 RepID=UPI0032F44F37|nr:uracil-DNA glycosylase family protein [Thiotrichaceae bacterium]
MTDTLKTLLTQVRGCELCADHLPNPPKPVIRVGLEAKVLVVGQAPSTRVHATGLPWNDASGKRLREWLQIDKETFYDTRYLSIMPMGLCYPGKGKSGDLPPRPECAPLWHPQVLAELPQIQLKLLIGQYAQRYYLGDKCCKTLTENVKKWQTFLPEYLPLPHPSPRNQLWLKRNPWFEQEVVPALRQRVKELLVL